MHATRNSSHNTPNRNGLALALAITITLLITACGGGAADSTNPQVFISSGDTSATASYQLTGGAFDNTAVTQLVYTLGGSAEQALTLSSGQFSAAVTLAPGDNAITVTARDAAGNEGSASITVDYQAAPTGESGHPDIAARGDTIQLTGNGFGTSGSIDIGGTPASADDWNDTEITLTIPANSPGGPQTITVHGPYGAATFDIFIGIEFDGDTLDELAALGLPTDTAVRLVAKTYTQTDIFVFLTDLSLYGQGEAETLIDTDGGILIFETAVHSTIQDLTIVSDAVIVLAAAPGPIGPLTATSTADFLGDFDLASVLTAEALAAAQEAAEGGELAAQATGSSSLTIRDATIAEDIGGLLGFITFDLFAPMEIPFPGSIVLERATLAQGDSYAVLASGGDITVTDSVIETEAFEFLAPAGSIDVRGSQLSNGTSSGPLFSTGFFAQNNVTLVSNTISNESYSVAVAPMWLITGVLLPTGADYHVESNVFTSIDADPLDATHTGSLMLVQPPGNGHVFHNSFEVHRGVQFLTIGGSLDLRGNEFELGHAAIASSGIQLGSGLMPSYTEFTGNEVVLHSQGGMYVIGVNHVVISDSSFTGFGGTGTALNISQSSDMELRLDVLNNTFGDFENALFIDGDGAGAGHLTLALHYNIFDFAIDAAGKVAILEDVEEADLNADFNQWGEEDDIPTLNGWIVNNGTTPAGTLVINDVLE